MKITCDSQVVIFIANISIFHKRTKNFENCHFIQEKVL